MTKVIRWGILSTGNIAHALAGDLPLVENSELLAVASRSQTSADKFGDQYNIPRRYASYEDMVNDPDIDVIYVATPHGRHYADAMLCLRGGKAVLCEKAFALNAKETRALIQYARANDLFLMEAMWSRFIPAIQQIQNLIQSGAIGQVRMVTANFGFNADFDATSRLFDPQLGGGALLDIGIYPLTLAWLICGAPESIVSRAITGKTGVDEQAGVVMRYPDGAIANLVFSLQAKMPDTASIYGTEGTINIHPRWWYTKSFEIVRPSGEIELIDAPYAGRGYQFEAQEVVNCLLSGQLESNTAPLDETLAIMEIMDGLRSDWGVKYPHEME